MAGRKGFEPSIFSVTGRRVNRATPPTQVGFAAKKYHDAARLASSSAQLVSYPDMTPPRIRFPHDEGPHPHSFEWWYWNANLKTSSGKRCSAMFTLFRAKLNPFLPELWSTHTVVSHEGSAAVSPRFGFYSSLAQDEWKKGGFVIRADHQFEMKRDGVNLYTLSTPDMDLRLTSQKPPLLIGGAGHVDLRSSEAFYYSLPRLAVEGTIRIKGRRTRVSGLAWMDHQWNPFTLSRENVWNWFSIHLSDGTDLMCFEFGRTTPVRLATISRPDGSTIVSKRVSFVAPKRPWKSGTTDIPYDLSWQIKIPDAKIDLAVDPITKKNEVLFGPVVYWEGPTRVRGSIGGRAVTGDGFLEIVPRSDLKQVALALAKKGGQDVLRHVGSAIRAILTRVG